VICQIDDLYRRFAKLAIYTSSLPNWRLVLAICQTGDLLNRRFAKLTICQIGDLYWRFAKLAICAGGLPNWRFGSLLD